MNNRTSIHTERKRWLILLLSLFLLFPAAKAGGPENPEKKWVVVIDAGHGGKDPGSVGKLGYEKDIVLSIALKTGKYIRENLPDVKVIYTRDADVFPELWERADIANKNKADLFISIHANAFPKSSAVRGTETYIMGHTKDAQNLEVAKKENSVITLEDDYTVRYEGFDPQSTESYIIFSLMQNAHQELSLRFAGYVQNQFRERVKRVDRGVKQAGFLVLYLTSMPSVLIETGYITNTREEAYLNSDEGQTYLASAIYRAFKEYKTDIEQRSDFSVKKTTVRPAEKEETEKSQNRESEDNIIFMVQIASSKKPVGIEPARFKGLKDVREIPSGNLFKYATGQSFAYQEALEKKENLKTLFPDAFIIALKNGKIIPLKEALDEKK